MMMEERLETICLSRRYISLVTTRSLSRLSSSTRLTPDTSLAWLPASRGKDIRARDILLTLYNMARGEGLTLEQPMSGLLSS